MGKRFDELAELSASDRAQLLSDAMETLEHALTAARERNAGKQVVADTKAGETSGMILSLLAEKIYRREVDIRAAFLRFDMGDGKIGSEDLGYALDQLGIRVDKAQLRDLMRVFDTDGSGSVDYEEFCSAVEEAAFLRRDEASTLSRRLAEAHPRRAGSRGMPRRSRDARTEEASDAVRLHVWNKHGTLQQAWRAYRSVSRRPELRLSGLASALRREGFPVPLAQLQAMMDSAGLEGCTLTFAQFRLLLSRPEGPAEDASAAMGASRRREPSRTRSRPATALPRSHAPRVASYRSYEAADPLAGSGVRGGMADLLERVGDAFASTSLSARDIHDGMAERGAAGCPPHDLRRGLHRIGCDISEAEAQALVARFDADHDGQLSFREFLVLVREAAIASGAM
ncbi:hypothetical protein FNF27_01536 [Cafeteria roenbergensis]|nr:hypothetical protein FNF29_07423 [Cafeteria roenbergensis]KAA0177207.1 hypothetical protein FNF27_01536 [Cafeteria roenbergensis]|eukprot:KAA0147355.1 hypothetical protein FNF29_07423 [Cafeteria roenbergensis]